jgi:hypothetical protein
VAKEGGGDVLFAHLRLPDLPPLLGIQYNHILIPEPYKSGLYEDVKKAILEAWNRIVFYDTCILYLAQKP